MPKQTILDHSTEQPKQLSDNFLVVHDQILQPWICEEIMVEYDKMPLVETEQVEGPNNLKPKESLNFPEGRNFKYESQNRIHANLFPGPEHDHIFERIDWALPKGWAFGSVNYVQIIKYQEGSHFPWHMDVADDNDTGTCMVLLNDNFIGGQLNVAGHRFLTKQGTIIAFNNSTSVWHSVEPIYKGERYCLAIWFGAPRDEEGRRLPAEENVYDEDEET